MRLSIRAKILSSAIFILIAMAIVGWRGIEGMKDINKMLNDIQTNQFAPTQLIANANIGVLAWNRATLNHILGESFQKMDESERIMLDQKTSVIEHLQQLSQTGRLSERGKELVLEVLNHFSEADPILNRVLMLSRAGKQEDARYLVMKELRPITDHMDADMFGFLQYQGGQLKDTLQAANERYLQGLTRIFIIIGVAISFAIFLFGFLTNTLVKNVNKLVRGAKSAAAGDLIQAKITITSKDEFEYLGTAFNQMLDNLFRSMNELKEMEASLKVRNTALETSNKNLDEFAYIVSHDLREPLRGIRSLCSFMLEDDADKLDSNGRSRLKRMMKLCRRLDDFIESILYYSRVGREALSMEEIDLNAVVQEFIDTIKLSLDEEGIELRIPKKLPAIACNRSRIGDVFSNLIVNAMKYNDKPEKWIEIGFKQNQHPYVFYVSDNGIGIREKHQEKIFKIFQRLHGREEFGGGTGAGLTIVKKIIDRHGGKLWVESTFGEGTTFYFTLQGGER